MKNQFKAGDLALIVGSRKSAINIGKCCELIAFLKPGERTNHPHITSDGSLSAGFRNAADVPGWLVFGEALRSPKNADGFILALEKHLRPLRGDFEKEKIKTREITA